MEKTAIMWNLKFFPNFEQPNFVCVCVCVCVRNKLRNMNILLNTVWKNSEGAKYNETFLLV